MTSMAVYRKKRNAVARKIAGETLLAPVCGNLADMDKVYVLHGCAEFIWEKLDGSAGTGDILREVVSNFDVSEAGARTDLDGLIRDLLADDLIEEAAQ